MKTKTRSTLMLKFGLPLLCALAFGAVAQAAETTLVCQLTGKEMTQCCCEPQKDGKLLCKNTGQLLEKCCCTSKETEAKS